MNTVIIKVMSLEETKQGIAAALSGDKNERGSFITFLDWEQFHKTLSPKRMAIIKAMAGSGELSIREVARRVGRDVKAVHGDVQALLLVSILERAENGVIFPYEEIHFDFTVRAAA